MLLRNVPDRAWFATLGLGAVGLVAVGLEMQAILRLSPCPLCIFQRVLYLLIGVVGLVGFLVPAGRLLWAGLIGLIGLGGVAVAGYQSWMQAFPHLAKECSYTDNNDIERLVDWLGMEWPSLFLATGFCSSRDWEFLGLTMANWSLLVFAGFVVFAAWLIKKRKG